MPENVWPLMLQENEQLVAVPLTVHMTPDAEPAHPHELVEPSLTLQQLGEPDPPPLLELEHPASATRIAQHTEMARRFFPIAWSLPRDD
jgi:hypothetical protein